MQNEQALRHRITIDIFNPDEISRVLAYAGEVSSILNYHGVKRFFRGRLKAHEPHNESQL